MADIPLYGDDQEVPVGRPPADVRITEASLQPYPDGRRVKLNLRLTPFLERPSLDATVTNAAGDEVASLSLIEAMDTEFDFTVHLRGPRPAGEHELRLELYYTEGGQPGGARQVVDERRVTFTALDGAPG
jgi:hypothetical protein